VILLAEYENCRLFTAREPMFWFSETANDLPGWSQFESTAGNASSPHRPVVLVGDLFVHVSCV